ncbi:polygalacturonase inhibitor-like [Henckelia pumila]|uniref:polygalacturonase inhibitor-like n=1 Tax=Henckelia pumila TaxID=405737 RepID=UPI003C6E981B
MNNIKLVYNILLPLLLLLLLSEFHVSHSAKCHPEDKKVLLAIKKYYKNAYDMISWDPHTGCCGWNSVSCGENTDRIDDIDLTYSTDITGNITDLFGDLPYLESLTLHKIPGLIGTIPRNITKLTKLTTLSITWTNISGPIPSYLGELETLTFLDLSFNNLSGSIPPSLSNLRNLGGLRLDRNRLSGSIPESLGNLTPSLQYLYLSHNQLSGTLPKGWGDLPFLIMELQRNKLQGDVTFLFEKNKGIQRVDFSRNQLEFDMSNADFPESLFNLDFNHNKIYGSLPQSLVKQENAYLNVSYNRLCGKIPVGGRLQQMGYTDFFHNRCLCGDPLPQCNH